MWRRTRIALALVLCVPLFAQTVEFELRTSPGTPVSFADNARAPAGIPGRQLVTIRNDAKKSVAAVVFEQSLERGSKIEIVALEHVSILFAAGEKRRVSLAVSDMTEKLRASESTVSAILRVVAVEFMDGSQWNAPTASDEQVGGHDGDGLPAQQNAIALQSDAHHATALRSLKRHELRLAETFAPVGTEGDVRRAGDRVLIDSRTGRKESRDEIVLAAGGSRRDDDAAHRNLAQRGMIGRHGAHRLFGIDFHQVVEGVLADEGGVRDSQRGQ
jgi:hypothetical protein